LPFTNSLGVSTIPLIIFNQSEVATITKSHSTILVNTKPEKQEIPGHKDYLVPPNENLKCTH
jgi:hypothetical protein